MLAHETSTSLVQLPTGAGEPTAITSIDVFDQGVRWFPDGRRILIAGSYQGSGYRLCIHNLDSGEITPLTPEGISGAGQQAWAISPDGRRVAAMNETKQLTIYTVRGGNSTRVIDAEPEEIPITWSEDGTSLFVYRPSDLPAKVYRLDLSTGSRELWKQFAPADPAGVDRIAPIFVTPDTTTYAYNTFRTLSTLYVAEGLK